MSQELSLRFMLDGSHQALPCHILIPQYLFNLTLGRIFNLLVQSGKNCFQCMKPRSSNNCCVGRVGIHNDEIYLYHFWTSLHR